MLYFAKFKRINTGLFIFKTSKERDKWVNFQDDFSLTLNCTKENTYLQREAISLERAEKIAGDSFDDLNNYQYDDFYKALILKCKPRLTSEIIEDMRYKRIIDLFRENEG